MQRLSQYFNGEKPTPPPHGSFQVLHFPLPLFFFFPPRLESTVRIPNLPFMQQFHRQKGDDLAVLTDKECAMAHD